MSRRRSIVVKKILLATIAMLLLWPVALVVADSGGDVAQVADGGPALPRQQSDEPLWMFSSYEWSTAGPNGCPDPPIFKYGTRTVHSYIPGILNEAIPAAAVLYELDDEGNLIGDPIAIDEVVLAANAMPHVAFSFSPGTTGIFGVFLLIEDGSGDWVLVANGFFAIAPDDYDAPEPGQCFLPEDWGGASTGTDSTGSGESTDDTGLSLTWSKEMVYEGRAGESRWCETQVIYQNGSGETYNWPDYRPLFLILNSDDTEDGWYWADYYRQEDGWENGIAGTPPPIAAGSSADWTWYSYTERAGQYCAVVAGVWQDYIYYAAYDPAGQLVETGAVPVE